MPTKAYFPRPHHDIDTTRDSKGKPRRGPAAAKQSPGKRPPAVTHKAAGKAPKVAGKAHKAAPRIVPRAVPKVVAKVAPRAATKPTRPGARPGAHPGAHDDQRDPLSTEVRVGDWLWPCRFGSEPDLCDELATYGLTGRVVQPALCASSARPRTPHKIDAELTFARQGMPVQAILNADADLVAAQLLRSPPKPLALHVFSPDSDAGNLRSAAALALQARLTEALRAKGANVLPDGRAAHEAGGALAQVCLLDDTKVAVGVLLARAAPSVFPGGRQRFKRVKDAPARSGLKLTEALAWLGHGPQAGEVCVDLGAAPGGWSQVLLERRCHVVAIDPARMSPQVTGRLEHLRMNAFSFEPEIPADWVLCDMAYRPLEVAALLAKWGRHRWAQFLLANIKLPMNRRVDMLARVREILTTGGWTGLRMRQLYHDRHEVTLTAWRGFGIDTRIPNRSPLAPSPRPPR